MDSAATFNNQTALKDVYQKGYAKTLNLTYAAADGDVTYKTGCSVAAVAADSRRASMKVQYSSVVSDASGVDTTAASQGVTDASSFVSNVNSVISSDQTAYSSVSTVSANDITSVASAISVVWPTWPLSSCPTGTLRLNRLNQSGMFWQEALQNRFCYQINCSTMGLWADESGVTANQACAECGGGQPACSDDESLQKAVLMELYNVTGGPSWTRCNGALDAHGNAQHGLVWGSNSTICEWICVTCNPYFKGYWNSAAGDVLKAIFSSTDPFGLRHGHSDALSLDLWESHLVGTLPASLLKLTQLIRLYTMPENHGFANGDLNLLSGKPAPAAPCPCLQPLPANLLQNVVAPCCVQFCWCISCDLVMGL